MQHVGAPRGVRPGRRLRRGPRPDRAQPAGLRGDGVLHPGPADLPPDGSRGADRVRAHRAGRPPGERRPGAVGVPATAQLVGGLVEGGGVAAGGQRRRPVHRAHLRGHRAARSGGPGAAGGAARVGAGDRDGPRPRRPRGTCAGSCPARRRRCGCRPRTPSRPRDPSRVPRASCPRRTGPAVPERRPATARPRGTETRPPPPHRRVTSFVHQRIRFTEGQAHAWERLWPVYGLDVADVVSGTVPTTRLPGSGAAPRWSSRSARAPGSRPRRRPPRRRTPTTSPSRSSSPGSRSCSCASRKPALTNLRLLRGDAVDLLRERVPPGSLAAVRIFFPDPWPKRRHHKRRLVQPEFVALAASRLAPGGVLHLATDWAHYASQMRAACAGEPLLENTSTSEDGWTVRARPSARRPSSSAAPAAKAVMCGTSCSAGFRCAHRDRPVVLDERPASVPPVDLRLLRSALIHRTSVRLWVWPS